MPTIVHFEIPADDVARAKAFYEKLFSWKIFQAPGFDDYWFIETQGENCCCECKTQPSESAICGGLMKRQQPGHQITNYIGVASLEEYAEKVVKYGGRIVMSKTPVKAFGYFAICLDPEGNAFGLWETDEGAT